MSDINSTSDALKLALQQCGEVQDGSAPSAPLMLSKLNSAYLNLLSGGPLFLPEVGTPWTWARARNRKSIVLKSPFEDSATFTQDSAAGLFANAPSAALGSFKDRFLLITDEVEVYKILAHTAGSAAFTLEAAWIGATGSYPLKAVKLVYDIGAAEVMRMCAPIQIYNFQGFDADWNGQIYGCDIDTLMDNYPLSRIRSRVPERFAELYRSEDELLIQFSSYVIQDMKADFDYIPFPVALIDSKNSIPVIPFEHRQVLVDAASYLFAMSRNDANKDEFFKRTSAGLKAMQKADSRSKAQTTRTRGSIIPRREQLSRTRIRGGY